MLVALAALQFLDYGVLFDGQKQGVLSTGAGVVLRGRTMSMAVAAFVEDDEAGGRTYLAESNDRGKSWGRAAPFGQELGGGLVNDPDKEFLWLTLAGPTAKGTVLSLGYHLAHGANTKDRKQYDEDVRWRTSTMLIGRAKPPGGRFEYQQFPSGTFLGEQFPAPGLLLASGRIVLSVWGAKARGENWRCGVLLSDNDGRGWRYRDVGFEADLGIRDKRETPAGFNEQTLFQTRGGRLVSIIRGREKLGRVAGSPRDTYYFRSVSDDGGESWTKPEATDMAGTGAPAAGIALADGSLVMASRVPYSRTMYALPEKDLFGLIFFRSRDEGRSWKAEKIIQRTPEGAAFDNHYNAMNGQFVKTGREEWMYAFAQFSVKQKVHRVLRVKIKASR
jgi:hypothetical protein